MPCVSLQSGVANTTCGIKVGIGNTLWFFPGSTTTTRNLNFSFAGHIYRTTDIRFYAGYFDSISVTNGIGGATVAASVNGAYFRFDTTASDAHIMCCTSNGTTINAQSSGLSADTNTHVYYIQITTTNVLFYVDGALVATSTTDLPTASNAAAWQVTASWASATANPIIGLGTINNLQ